jgi:hypothetical protein
LHSTRTCACVLAVAFLQPTVARGVCAEGETIVHARLLHQLLEPALHCSSADMELGRDLLVSVVHQQCSEQRTLQVRDFPVSHYHSS